MEHEAERYQQRLQAIAEKRRLQEEQERAKREIEDERLRLQQLKRKSLRDQWLMEGPPTSPDSAGPRSPLWGPKAQEIEAHIEKLQTTSDRLAEEEVKLKSHAEDGPAVTEADAQTCGEEESAAVPVETVVPETAPNGPIVENGKDKKDDSVNVEDEVSEETEPIIDAEEETATKTTSAVVNGNMEGEISQNTPEEDESPRVNGVNTHPAEGIDLSGVTMTFLGFKEAEPGQGVNEDDDGGAVIHAERVIITDEGEEIVEEDTADTTQESATPAVNEDTSKSPEESDAVNEDTPKSPEESDAVNEDTSKTPEESDAVNECTSKSPEETETENHPEAPVDIKEDETLETGQKAEGQTPDLPDATDMQPQNETLDGAVEVSQVPVYSTTQPSPTTKPKAECESTESQPSKEDEVVAATPTFLSQFQEVPLDGNGETATEGQPAEQEPLLTSKTAAQLGASSPDRPEGTAAPKQKACQCCSIM